MRRIDQLELVVRRITQIDTKPRLIIPDVNFHIIEYTIDSLDDKISGPYTGLIAATATVRGVICGRGAALINTQVEVIDHSGCIFDVAGEMVGYTGWAVSNMEYWSLDYTDAEGDMTPCHYAAFNRCCAPDSGTYREATP